MFKHFITGKKRAQYVVGIHVPTQTVLQANRINKRMADNRFDQFLSIIHASDWIIYPVEFLQIAVAFNDLNCEVNSFPGIYELSIVK